MINTWATLKILVGSGAIGSQTMKDELGPLPARDIHARSQVGFGYAADSCVPAASHFIVINSDFAIGGCWGKIQIVAKEPPPSVG